MSILDSILTSLSRIPEAPRATWEYFQEHTLNDAFDLSANNTDRYLQAHRAPNWLQGLAGSTLSAGQLLWGIPLGLREMGRVAIDASPRGWQYTLASVGSFMIHGIVQGAGMVMGSVSSWSQGNLNDRNSFQIAREVTLTAGAGGMLLMGARNMTRGGGNFFNATRTVFQNAGEMSFSPASATAVISSMVSALPASGFSELGAGLCMMNATRPAQGGASSSTPTRARPDEELVRVPGREFIQGAELPNISFPDELPLRRVRLSPFRMLRSAVTNNLWAAYIRLFGDRPWAILGRVSNEPPNVNERGRWGVVRRGSNRAELEAWLNDYRKSGQVDDGRRVFDVDTCQVQRVIPENPLEHAEGFDHLDQPLVNVNWYQAVAAADGIGRMLSRGRALFHDLPANQAQRNAALFRQRLGLEEARMTEDVALSLEEASPGYLPTEAEWEGAGRGLLERIDVAPSEFQDFIMGPPINGRYFRGRIPRRENFVEIIDPTTMEFGREVFTDPNYSRVQDWLKKGVLGAWRVFAGDLENNIWSSVFEQRRATRSVLQEPANTSDLLGMNGNTWEWVDDWLGNYPANPSSGEVIINPRGQATGEFRVCRGGSWRYDSPRDLRAAFRLNLRPAVADFNLGLRLLVPL